MPIVNASISNNSTTKELSIVTKPQQVTVSQGEVISLEIFVSSHSAGNISLSATNVPEGIRLDILPSVGFSSGLFV
jgi:hypothetical protein